MPRYPNHSSIAFRFALRAIMTTTQVKCIHPLPNHHSPLCWKLSPTYFKAFGSLPNGEGHHSPNLQTNEDCSLIMAGSCQECLSITLGQERDFYKPWRTRKANLTNSEAGSQKKNLWPTRQEMKQIGAVIQLHDRVPGECKKGPAFCFQHRKTVRSAVHL